ncbi:response regulator transcription factor [Paenibacillus sp. Soil787]|uniref:response regulator transcription factor n=1 Tax=Paenibacillus sp. Soil787 TaxID=1736411 RepID=UPI0007025EE5|nr:response regulator [Paenibacillus sp. Soil787]KRF18419.1 hypothetical protein ASG93_10180 [Paenibacillus sp. Soil787]
MKQVKSLKIIVIEDEPIIQENIIKKIEENHSGFQVIAKAYNGKSGLDLIKQHKPDMIITDIRMPIMDGIELIRNVRFLFPDMPIIILSGYDDFEYARQALRFGVMEYLLKPLETGALLEALNRISNVVFPKSNLLERSIISSELLGQNHDLEISAFLSHSGFQMYLLCLGNLCNHVTSINRAQHYSHLWGKIDWEQTVEQFPYELQNWWLIDEMLSNQKFLIIAAGENEDIDIKFSAELLKASLLAVVEPYSLNISIHSGHTTSQELWEVAQELRSQLEKEMVIGKSGIICNSKEIKKEASASMIPASMNSKITSLLVAGNRELLRPVIFNLLESWERAAFPQRLIEKGLGDLVDIFWRNTLLSREEEWNDVKAQILDSISISVDYAIVCSNVWGILECFLEKKPIIDGAAEISDKLEHYILEHYAEDISFEELAQQFNFSSAYLTKIFKKYKNETPLKYLINLRIEEAKRLIIEHKEIDLKIIAEMVGYFDQHYFSKVFKYNVGITPTEFKENYK